jgi:hypothetical protein
MFSGVPVSTGKGSAGYPNPNGGHLPEEFPATFPKLPAGTVLFMNSWDLVVW